MEGKTKRVHILPQVSKTKVKVSKMKFRGKSNCCLEKLNFLYLVFTFWIIVLFICTESNVFIMLPPDYMCPQIYRDRCLTHLGFYWVQHTLILALPISSVYAHLLRPSRPPHPSVLALPVGLRTSVMSYDMVPWCKGRHLYTSSQANHTLINYMRICTYICNHTLLLIISHIVYFTLLCSCIGTFLYSHLYTIL